MEELTYEQRSPEWFSARLGKITGSKISDLMPSEKARLKFTKAQREKLVEIASEVLTGEWEESYISKPMQWGIDHEQEALDLINFVKGESFRECGFFTDHKYLGASPDGISDTHVLELKCPSSKKHLLYLLDSDNLVSDYEHQVYMEMYCTGKDNALLCSYDPRFKDLQKQLVIVEIKAEPEKMVKLQNRLRECIEELENILS